MKYFKKNIIEKTDDKIIKTTFQTQDVEIMNKALNINNALLRKFYVYKIIDLDGISIGNYIYSKKYEKPMICGHWKYMQAYDDANKQSQKNIKAKNLIARFGNYVKKDSSNIYCKICGEPLDIIDYDELGGWDDYGHINTHRAVMTQKERNPSVLVTRESDKPKTLFLSDVDCSDKQFREYLRDSGISFSNLRLSFDICNILKKINEKIGLNIRSNHFIEVITESTDLIKKILSLKIFKAKIVSDLTKLGKIDKIQILEGTTFFQDTYEEYYNLEKYAIIVCRLLICIQTSVPKYTLNKPKTACSLNSWDDGLIYLTCIIKELSVLNYERVKKDGSKIKKITKEIDILEKFKEVYDKFKKELNIIDLFKKRDDYNDDLKHKNEEIKIKKDYQLIFKKGVVPGKLPKDFKQYLLGNKGVINIKEDYDKYYARQLYLNIEILSIINYVIGQSPIENIVNLANACCPCKISDNENAIDYIIKNNNVIKELLEESFHIWEYDKLFLTTGTSTRLYPSGRLWESISKVGDIIDQTICDLTYLYYNYKNEFSGIRRIYIGDENNKYDIVSGEYMNDIKKVNFSREEYDRLLDDIYKKNIMPVSYYQFEIKLEYKDLEGRDYHSKIESLGNKLTSLLGESSEFKIDLKQQLNNLGIIFDEDKEFSNIKNQVKHKEYKYVNRINNLKNYINNYFRKYLNMVKNKLRQLLPKVQLDAEPDEKREFMTLLKKEIDYFEDFYKYNKLFESLNICYTADQIDNMTG